MNPDRMTADEVADRTGFSRSHVYRHYLAFGGIKIGGAVKFSKAAVERLFPTPQNETPAAATNSAGA